jgi:hypothetical protein
MARKFSRKDFLEALYGEYFKKREGFIMVKTGKRLDPRVSTRYFPNLEILAKEQYHEDQNVFFGVCPHESMKPDSGQISYITALWAGLDLNSSGYSGPNLYFTNKSHAAKAIRSFPLPPSVIVESGWGVHLYWLLEEVVPLTSIEATERLLALVNSYFLCRSEVKIDAMMRLPVTFNDRVPGEVTNCFVKYVNQDFRYSLEDFAGLNLTVDEHMAQNESATLLDKKPRDPEALPGSPVILGAEGPEAVSESNLWEPPPGARPAPAVGKSAHVIKGHFPSNARTEASAKVQSVQLSARDADQPTEQTEIVEAEELSETLADEIADKVVEKLSARLADKLVDQVVDRLYKLLNGGDKR